MKTPIYWLKAKKYLSEKDKELSRIIKTYEGFLSTRNDPFYSLCKSIVGQQISVQAANSVWNKLSDKCKTVSPENVNQLQRTDLLKCGLSRQKVEYIKVLSKNFLNLFNKIFNPSLTLCICADTYNFKTCVFVFLI